MSAPPNDAAVRHSYFNAPKRCGVLLVAEGAPESTSLRGVWQFLHRKLMNPRSYRSLPRWLWRILVYTVMLPCTVLDQQKMYQDIWLDAASRRPSWIGDRVVRNFGPVSGIRSGNGVARVVECALQLGGIMEDELRQLLPHNGISSDVDISVQVEVGFYNCDGSVEAALERLQLHGCRPSDVSARGTAGDPVVTRSEHLLIVPLAAHYRSDVTGSVWDATMLSSYFQRHSSIPNVHFIRSYASQEAYVETWHRHIRHYLGAHGMPDRLFIAFDGAPHLYTGEKQQSEGGGHLYYEACHCTADALRRRLSAPWSPATPFRTPAFGAAPTAQEDASFFSGAVGADRATTAFFEVGGRCGHRVPRLEDAFVREMRQLRRGVCPTGLILADGASHTAQKKVPSCGLSASSASLSASATTPLPFTDGVAAPTAVIVCPGEAFDDSWMRWKLQHSFVPWVRKLGWRDVQCMPTLNDTTEHAQVLSAVVLPYLL